MLTDCDAFDNFLPPLFRGLQVAARVPGALNALVQPLRIRALRRLPMAYGMVDEAADRPRGDRRVAAPVPRSSARCAATPPSSCAASAAATRSRPPSGCAASIARRSWPGRARTAPSRSPTPTASPALLPDARVEEIEDSLAFVPEDQPERLADAIARFVRETG